MRIGEHFYSKASAYDSFNVLTSYKTSPVQLETICGHLSKKVRRKNAR